MQNQLGTIDARPIAWASRFVQRVGDSFERACPSCHHVGQVGIYPNREQESFRFISCRDWVCRWCEDTRHEVQDATLSRDGD